jgi:integrase
VIVGTPMTHYRRSVPVPPFVMHAIAEAMRGKQQTDLLFADAAGRHLRTPTVHEHSWLDRALAVAGLPSMTIYDLRHTAASLAVAAGANVKAVKKMLGHASASMTLDVYTDLFDDDLDAVAQRLDEAAMRSDVLKMWSNGAAGASRKPPEGGQIRMIPGSWGGRDLNPRPRDYESPALTG